MNSSASLSSSSMSDDARARKRKKAKKKAKSRKESGSVFSTDDLDLNKEVFPIGHYIDDRQEMIRQVFNVVKGARLQAMLPPLLKELPMEEIISKCFEQLKSMSKEAVSRVLAGKEGSPLRPAPIPNSQLPTRLVEHQGAIASEVWAGAEESGSYVVKRKSVEKELRTEQSAKKQKMAGGEAENEEGKTLMEILEMEMRARAIKAMLRRDKEVETETENPAGRSQDPESLILGTGQVLHAEADENRDQQQVDSWEGGENDVMADWPPAMTAATRKSPQVEPVMQKKDSPTREEKRARARAINSAISIKRTLLGEADSTKQNEQDASFIKDKSLPKEGAFEAKKKWSQSDKKKKKDKGKTHKEEDGDRREKKESKKTKEHDGTSVEKILPQVQQRQYRKAERWPGAARKRSSRSHSPGLKTEKNPNQKSSKTRKSRQRNSSISLSASPPIRPVESFQNRHVDSSSAPRRSPLNVGSPRRQEHGSSFSQDDERDARYRRYSRSPLASRSRPKARQDVSPRTRRVAKVAGYESILPVSPPREVDAGRRKEHDRRPYKSWSSVAVYETDVVAIRNLEDGELETSEEGEIDSSGDDVQSPQGMAGANHDPLMKVSMKIHKSSRNFLLPKRTFGSCNLNPSSEQENKFQGRETAELEKVSDSEEDFTTDMNLNDLSNGPELPVLNPEYDVSFGDVEDEHSHDKAISLSPRARPNDDTAIPGLVEQNGQLGHHISQEAAKLYEDSNVLAHDEGGLDQQPVLGNFGYDSKDLGEEEADPPSIEELLFDWDTKAASKAVGLTSEGHNAERHLFESDKNEIVSKLRDDHNNEVEELQKIQSRSHVEAQPAHPTELSEIGKGENQQSDVYASDINNSIQVADSSGPETKQVLIEISDKKKDEESTSRSTASVPDQGVIEKTCSLESNSVGLDVTAVVEQRSGQIEGQEDSNSIPESSMILGENNSSVVAANSEIVTKKNLSTEESIQIEEVGTEDRIVISETLEGREVLSMSEFKKQQKLKTSDKDDVEDEDCGAVSWSERWYRSHKVKKVVETSRMFGKVRSQLRTKLLDKKGESHMEDSSSGHSSESTMPVEVNGSLAEYEQLTGKKIVTDEGKQDTLTLTELSVTPPPPPPEEEDSAEEDLWGQILG